MPTYEYKCKDGHFSTAQQKYSQGKPLGECGFEKIIESGLNGSYIEPCRLRPKRFYGPVTFVVR